ncbi:MAG: hypothetical protein M1836_003210 [Candelina mexicana]|nr:MAG: hypothetical protein M1836_003210 [Candelina mexicana]
MFSDEASSSSTPLLLSSSVSGNTIMDDRTMDDKAIGMADGGSRAVDPELEGLTLYEKKAMLVNRELDAMGMGKYQWYIFFLCGCGYLIDLMWAQVFGLVTSPLQQEIGFPDVQLGNISTCFSAGLTAGAGFWGILVDIVGRQWAFNLTVLISSVFGLCLAAPSTYTGILVLTAFIGFGVGGNIPIDTTITLEFLPQNRRFLLAALSIFQPIGVVIASGLAYGYIPSHSCPTDLKSCNASPKPTPCCTKAENFGWRYLILTTGAITLGVFFLRFVIFRFQESPKFLLSKGKDEKAIEVLQYIARFNGRENHITLEDFNRLSDEDSSVGSSGSEGPMLNPKRFKKGFVPKITSELNRFKILFSSVTMTRLTILVWVTYAFDYWGFTIAGSFLPTILKRKNEAINVGIRDTYLSYIYIYLPGIVGVLLGALCYQIPRVGRQITMIVSSALMGASLFLFAAVNTQKSNIGLNAMEYFFQSTFNAVLYGWTPEAFPAPIRGTASGLASFWGRLFSIVSPLIAAHLLVKGTNDVLYLAGGGVFVCTVTLALLPRKAMGGQSF